MDSLGADRAGNGNGKGGGGTTKSEERRWARLFDDGEGFGIGVADGGLSRTILLDLGSGGVG